MNDTDRRAQLAANLEAVRARIAAACRSAARDPAEVGLVVVTKYFPAADVRLLAGLGVAEVGENRHQEAVEKAAACADLGLRWHFIGALQSNKAAAVAGYADVVESVDRRKLVPALARGAAAAGRVVECLIQVSLDPPGRPGRSGAGAEEVPALAEAVLAAPDLRLGGVMGVAPLGQDPGPAFARLAELAETVRGLDPSARVVSAGMSGDLEEAIRHGATHVRIGSAVLGPRPQIK